MLFDIFSRLFLAFTSLAIPPEMAPNSARSLIPHPSNISIANWIDDYWFMDDNDTVVVDNPKNEYENGQVIDNAGIWSMITLPLCSSFIDPEGVIIPSEENHLDMGKATYYWYPAPHLFPSDNRSHYKFQVRKPTCDNGSQKLKSIQLSMDDFEMVGSGHGRFLRNGYFGFNNLEFYSPQEYCISTMNPEFVQVLICESQEVDCSMTNPWNMEGKSPCIQKCCNPDEIYSFTRRACVKSSTGTLFHPTLYNHLSSRLSPSEQQLTHLPHYHIKFPRDFKFQCEENRTQIFPAGQVFAEYLSNFTGRKYHSAHFKIRKDGKIMYRKDGKAILMPDRDLPVYLKEQSKKCYTLKPTAFYCIDGAAEYGSPDPFSNDEGEMFLVTCSEYLVTQPEIGPLSFVYGNVMIASSVFSLLTVLVYSVLKEKQNIHGWTIASYALSMFFMYIFLGLAHLIRYYGSDEVLKTASCVTVGIASHLFSLASFIWLFLINWDIWWTFRKFRPTRNNNSSQQLRGKELKRFAMYSAVGWGIPIIIMGVTTFLHFKYEDVSENECAIVKAPLPAYGRESCEIKQLSLGVYLYFPAAFLLTCNLVFFGVTMYTLCRHSITTQLATKSLERHRQSFQLFAKLFFVMGVTRVFEVITWAGSGPTLTWYWAVFDIFNVLQAVAIFIVYVCKRDVLLSLKKLFIRRFKDDGTCTSTRRELSGNSKTKRKASYRKFWKRYQQRGLFASMIDSVSATVNAPVLMVPSFSNEKIICPASEAHE